MRGCWLAGFLTALLMVSRAEALPGDEYIVEVWDTDRGLPHNTVTSLAQTPEGYLWVGTLHGGLARFDGVRFATYHPGNTPELNSIEIRKLLVDAEGTLWIGLVEGMVVSRRDGNFHFEFADTRTPDSWVEGIVSRGTNETILSSALGWLFRGDTTDGTNRWQTIKPPETGAVTRFYQDRDGIIWYRRTNGRLARVAGNEFELAGDFPGLANQPVSSIAQDREGHIWIGTGGKLARWDGKQFVNMTPTNSAPVLGIQQLVPAPDAGFWVLSPDRLRKYVAGRWAVDTSLSGVELKTSRRPTVLLPDDQGGAWLLSYDSGLWHVDSSGVVSLIGPEQGLPSNLFESWLLDREGNLWLGLSGSGLAGVRKRVFNTVHAFEALTDRAVRSVCEDADGTLWFGTSGNKVLRWGDGQLSETTLPVREAIGRDTTVCPGAAGNLWIGSVQNGAWVLQSNQLTEPFTSPSIGTVVRAFYQDKDRMWIGNEFGLYCWETNQLKHFTTADGFADAYILSITKDASNTLWMGTAVGELRSYRDGKFTSYRPADSIGALHPKFENPGAGTDSAPRGTLSGGERFWALRFDRNQTLWIGTLGGGLLRFKTGVFTRYGIQQGLPNEHVSQILEDHRGQLWLGTRGGVARVRLEDLERFASGESEIVPFTTYGTSDGLPSIDCSGGCQPGCWTTRDGQLWFTTAKGPAWVRPGKLQHNPHPPPVAIEELWVDKQLVYEPNPGPRRNRDDESPTDSSTPNASLLRIPAGRHYFEFKFTALSLVSPDKVRFKWLLHGAGRDWPGSGAERTVSYSYLPPGDYEFQVHASNNDGVWSENGARLPFRVLPHYWETWWFKLLIAVAVVGLLYAAYAIRIARLRSLERLRLRIARDLHDDVGANLGSISLLSQVMEAHPNPEDARQIRGIVGQTVDTLRDIVWFIDPTHERLSDLVSRMAETAKAMLFATPYTFEQSGDFRSTALPLDFRRNVMPIFKEALHNTLRHGHPRHIAIRVTSTNKHFSFSIQDDGCGFDPTKPSSGNGLKNFRRRAAEMKATLEVNSAPGKGTCVKLTAKTP